MNQKSLLEGLKSEATRLHKTFQTDFPDLDKRMRVTLLDPSVSKTKSRVCPILFNSQKFCTAQFAHCLNAASLVEATLRSVRADYERFLIGMVQSEVLVNTEIELWGKWYIEVEEMSIFHFSCSSEIREATYNHEP